MLLILIGTMGLSTLGFSQDYGWEAELKTNLEKLADSLTENIQQWKVPDAVFDVDDHGAKGDGKTKNTTAIQKAIDACSAAGGGVVLLDSGDYLTGTIRLKSNVMLEIAEGSRMLGSPDLADYPDNKEELVSIMSEYLKKYKSLIYAENAENIGIRGKGEIDFQGGQSNFPGRETIGPMPGRPFGIRVFQCNNISVKDITLRNAAAWMQNYVYCNRLIFDGMKVISGTNVNNDGLDIDGCDGVIVRDCYIHSEDDAMCFKGASGKPTQNILVENSTFETTCNPFKIGTDTQGSFKNIIGRNLVLGGIPKDKKSLRGHQASTGITLATVDGGNVENIYMTDITIYRARCPIFIRIGSRGRVIDGWDKPPVGHLKNILIENVTGSNNHRQGSFISGIADKKVSNVIIRNYDVKMEGGGSSEQANATIHENEKGYPDAHQFSGRGLPAYGFYIRHAQNIWLDNVKTTPDNPDQRPEFVAAKNIKNISVNGRKLALTAIRISDASDEDK